MLRVWRAEGRVREEHEGGSRDGAYLVRDGDAWWTWDERNGAHSNEGDLTSGYSDGEQISLILDPTPLLGTLRFTPTGRGHLAGRETITADAVPRLSDRRDGRHVFELYALGGGADHYVLQVDAERGVLLEAVAFRDGEPFQRITTEQVVFDHAIDPERFRFAPPAGEEIRSPLSSRVQHVPLAEAQQLAPFTVLVPERIPTDWFGSYTFIEPSQQPPSAACVSIHFRSHNGHESVSLSQYAIGDQPDEYNLMLKRDDWQTITRNGTDVKLWAPRRGRNPQREDLPRNLRRECRSLRIGNPPYGLRSSPSSAVRDTSRSGRCTNVGLDHRPARSRSTGELGQKRIQG